VSFLTELKRRNVLRVALGYLAISWLFIQITETIFPLFGLPDAAARMVVVVFGVGFIPVLIFSWVFEFTPQGLKREKNFGRNQPGLLSHARHFDRVVMLLLALAVGYFMFDKFVLDPARDANRAEEIAREARSEALAGSYGDKSIAVLPFVNMSDDPGNEYFAEGISEELLNLLARVPQLRVISRSSSFTFRDKSVDISSVAGQLHVAHVLEGSVRKSGDRVRITAQLIEAGSDTQLWSNTYDRSLDDIFAVQDEIAAEVVSQLKIKLLGGMAVAEAADPEVYSSFLQARYLLNQYDVGTLPQAQELLRAALQRDPDYVPALLAMATLYVRQHIYGQRSKSDAEDLYRQTVAHARVLQPENPLVLSYIASASGIFEGDIKENAPGIARAFELDPQNASIAYQALRMARMTGRFELAIAIGEYLLTLDPLCGRCHFALGKAYIVAGRLDEAEAMMRKTLLLGQGWFNPHRMLVMIKLLQNQPNAALAELKRDDDPVSRAEGRTMIMHDLGRLAEFDAAFGELHGLVGDESNDKIYAWIGESDLAFEWLERRLERDLDNIAEIFNDPVYFKLHDDPRWIPFLEKVGESPDQLSAVDFDVRLPGADH